MVRFLFSFTRVGIFAILFLHATGCKESRAPVTPSNVYGFDEAELKVKISKAEAGDVEAMNELVGYYWIYKENEQERGLYWLKRAAIAGDADARKSFFDYCEEHISTSTDVCEKLLKE